MQKGRFWYFLIGDLVSIAILLFTIFYPTRYDIYLYIVIALIMIPNFTLRHAERNQLIRIIGDYANNCDSYVYYDNMIKFYKSLYLSKRARKLNNIVLAMIKIDMGEIDEAEELLTEIAPIIDKANPFNRYNYYRAWCGIYYERMQTNRYKILLEEACKIIDNQKPSIIKDQMATNFRYLEAKYFIMEGIYLDKARTLYDDTLTNNTSTLMRMVANYYLGVISAKSGQREKAIDYFKYLAFSDRKINLVSKAIKYVEALEK